MKFFALIRGGIFDKNVQFPIQISKNYILHDLINETFKYKMELKEWEINIARGTGLHSNIIEFKNEIEGKDFQWISGNVETIIAVIRLLKYIGIHYEKNVCFTNKKISSYGSPDIPFPSSSSRKDETISNEDIANIKKMLINYASLFIKRRNQRIARSIAFWDNSTCSGTYERKVVELFISLETLFTTSSEEISNKLANRMAWHLFPTDFDKRINLFKEVKKGYSIRSNLVHGKSFVEAKDLPIIQSIHDTTRKILKDIVLNKDLMDIFGQDNDKIEIYLNELSMGIRN